MTAPPAAPAVAPLLQKDPDFSLVLGGPLYQLWRGTRLAGDSVEHLLRRRLIVLALLTWAPLLLLSIATGRAWGNRVELTFLRDADLHLKLLLALPLLIVAELVIHQRMRPIVQQFVHRGLIPPAGRAQFDAAIASAMRLRNSVAAEVFLIAFVYIVGIGVLWRTQGSGSLGVAGWYGDPVNGRPQPSLAGWWLIAVSLPIFQFLLLRWYFRLFIWTRFLWQVSRIQLAIEPTHPDRCGGMGFMANIGYAFAPFLLAQGVLLAGTMGNRIFYSGAKLPQFKVEIIGLVAVMVLAILGPMLVFAQQLAAAKRAGMREFGLLAQDYVREFNRKWLRGGAPPEEPLVGSADIQSLADLGNSFEVVKSMRFVPFTMQTVLQLAVITVLPVAPLLLTMISLEQLLERLLVIIF